MFRIIQSIVVLAVHRTGNGILVLLYLTYRMVLSLAYIISTTVTLFLLW